MRFTAWGGGLVAYGVIAGSAAAADLTAYTEEWAPYNFSEGDRIRGVSTDLLRAACVEAGLSCDIKLVPWARAYAMALSTPNTIAYTTARKPERELNFRWVGPILPRQTWVFGRRGLHVQTFTDLNRYRVGVVRGEATISDLQAKGVLEDALDVESANTDIMTQFQRGRVDAVVDTEVGVAWQLLRAGLPADSMVRLLPLSGEGAYYFAVNLRSDPAFVDRLQRAVDKLRKSGAVDRLVAAYTRAEP